MSSNSQPPPFADREYWNKRFAAHPLPFDWLLPSNTLIPVIAPPAVSAPPATLVTVSRQQQPPPSILHIGCGNSDLSFRLRVLVERPEHVCNVDFAEEAVRWGRMMEEKIFSESNENGVAEHGGAGNGPATPSMLWTTADLLSYPSLSSACAPSAPYALIVDKSTSDSIACGEDIPIELPYTLSSTSAPATSTPAAARYVHPLHLLAVHLAALTAPGSRWVALSYSRSRFPFFEYADATPDEEIDDVLGEPAATAPGTPPGTRAGGWEGEGMVVHRPKIYHYLYVMVRTEKEVG
ncbi:hypothetical protein BDY21DRAFT_403397 [Lineolata rhizophorae]|uniref:Methyltransferase domain-containing protein n=1 Tax=Lineolata rhizophorae TaxID=578093 RepID=A0A6A6PAW6_9PEZI|nr:hypothetical protein BDY21DRAFT_403397 [Lineolata rhizophorae]